MNDTERIIYGAFYLALIEIREEAHNIQNKKIFHLADLFHNVPLQLEKVLEGEKSYEQILEWLHSRAEQKKCENWLNGAISNIIK